MTRFSDASPSGRPCTGPYAQSEQLDLAYQGQTLGKERREKDSAEQVHVTMNTGWGVELLLQAEGIDEHLLDSSLAWRAV